MALTRKMLKAMGIEDEKIDQIIEEHVESIDGLKAERDRYKAGAEEAEGLRKQLEEAKAELDAYLAAQVGTTPANEASAEEADPLA